TQRQRVEGGVEFQFTGEGADKQVVVDHLERRGFRVVDLVSRLRELNPADGAAGKVYDLRRGRLGGLRRRRLAAQLHLKLRRADQAGEFAAVGQVDVVYAVLFVLEDDGRQGFRIELERPVAGDDVDRPGGHLDGDA